MQLERVGEAMVLRMRAGKANAIGPAWLQRMEALLDEALAARARSLVITGYEGFFSAGLDLPALDALDEQAMGAFMSGFSRTMLRIFELPIPVVAAVNGHAIAGGCVLALQADVRIGATSDFRIGLNEVQLGIGLPAVVLESLRAGRAPVLARGGAVRRALARAVSRGPPRAAGGCAGDGAGGPAGLGVRHRQERAPSAGRAAGAGAREPGRFAVGGDLVHRRGPGAPPASDRAFVAQEVVAAGQSPPVRRRCAFGEAGRAAPCFSQRGGRG